MTIIPQLDYQRPTCPWSGVDGGPQNPAHAVEIAIADRAYAQFPRDADNEILPELASAYRATSERSGMELYQVMGSPIQPRLNYFTGSYFRCLTCGFVLPAQEMRR